MAESAEISSLVRSDAVHRRVYTDPDIFELEMKRIFERTWIYVGHDSQVAEPGQYYATTIGRRPVMMVRHRDGNVHVLHNRCAHKGTQLVGDCAGKVKDFRCAYHGWRFDTNGDLLSIPMEKGYEGTGFGKSCPDANIQHVARCEAYRGFVFASLCADGPDLKTWLGPVASSIDNMVERAPEGALEITGGSLRYLHDSNWKFFVENLNDMMHPMVVHQSSSLTARVAAKELLPQNEPAPMAIEILSPFTGSYSFFDKMGLHAFDYGHSYSGGKESIHAGYSDIEEYNEAMFAAYGKERTAEIFSVNRHNTIFYPSLTIKGPIQTIRVVRPISVNKTLIESWTLRLRGAPDKLLERSILYCNLINSSANLVGPDDHEAYHRQQAGLMSDGADWVSMHRDYAVEEEMLENGGRYARGTSDMVFRNQYVAWHSYMSEPGR